jgi:hypothetical protein
MKNIHVLPTENSNRLFKIAGTLIFDINGVKYTERYKQLHKYTNQNISITSDEEIKEGDYGLIGNEVMSYHQMHKKWGMPQGKKIILTTDQDLIKDGVQVIDDEFLEWFVKNPSCERVEVVKTNKLIDNYADKDEDKWEVKYHIYLPKEEFLKQERMSGSKTVSKILDGGKPSKFLIDEIGQFNFTKNKLYNQEEVGELVYKIIGEYGNHYGIMIDGEMINELFEKFKKK